MSATSAFTKRSLYHGLLPQTPAIHKQFLEDHFHGLPRGPVSGYGDAVEAFRDELKRQNILDEVTQLFNDAVKQAEKYDKWADKSHEVVENFDDLLTKINKVVEGPPDFYKATVDGNVTIGEPIGVPLYLIFDLISNTSAGYTLLTRGDFNVAVKALLNRWGEDLKDEKKESNKTLIDWFSKEGLAVLEAGLGKLTFDETFVTDFDPKKDLKRYKTWDTFFIREFKKKRPDGKTDVRPIANQPKDKHCFYIYNPCESTVFRTATNVQERDTFWIKSQNYSLYNMLGVESVDEKKYPGYAEAAKQYAKDLVGASVLQSFLAPQDYHCWQSPVDGTIEAAVVVDGTYYAVLPDEGAAAYDLDLLPGDPHGALIRSQPWLSVAATRAVFIIRPKGSDSNIDLIAFIAIGMVEVSSCEIAKGKGEKVNVGDVLGRFHFGGSSYTLIVKPKAGHEVIFQDVFNSPVRPGQHRWVRSVVGQVWPLKK